MVFLRNGLISCSKGLKLGSSCFHSCLQDFELVGSRRSVCLTKDGLASWTPALPICRALCPTANLSRGVVSCDRGRGIGSECDFVCVDGYELIGAARSVCSELASWNPVLPYCQVLCAIAQLPNGDISCTSGRSLGSECAFSCDSVHEIIGESTSVCVRESNDKANWSPTVPRCQALCPPKEIPRGSSRCSFVRSVGSVCNHTCDYGYEVIGKNNSVCIMSQDGKATWVPEFPKCQALCRTLALKNGAAFCTEGARINSTCYFQCDVDFELLGKEKSVCTIEDPDSPIWKPETPVCKPLCPTMVLGRGRNSSCTRGRSINSTCKFTCSFNYELIGSETSVCEENYKERAFWHPSIPKCQELCPTSKIVNGFSLCNLKRSINSTCMFGCDRGYELRGTNISVCLLQHEDWATWIPSLPYCHGVCPTLMISNSNTTCSNGTNLESRCKHMCNDGYELVGSEFSVCSLLQDRRIAWQPKLPYCEEISVTTTSPLTPCYLSNVTHGNISCSTTTEKSERSSMECSSFSLNNGSSQCSNGTRIYSSCIHQCDAGFELVGNVTSVCVEENQARWLPSLPRCRVLAAATQLAAGGIIGVFFGVLIALLVLGLAAVIIYHKLTKSAVDSIIGVSFTKQG